MMFQSKFGLTYDIVSIETLLDIEKVWIHDIKCQLPDALILLIGNKNDIDESST